MRILAVTPYYKPEGGGLERYAHAVLSRLAARGHEVRAVASTLRMPSRGVMDGVEVERSPARFSLGNAPIDPGLGRRLRRIMRDWNPDVVLGHAPVPFPAEVACAEARRAGIPFVLTYHAGRLRGSSLPLDAAATLARFTIERRMFANSAALIAVSRFVRDHALQRHRERVTIIPPGVDERMFSPGPPPQEPEILFVAPLARAYRWKGVDVLLEAFPTVQKAVPDACMRFVGTGDRVPEFERLARHSAGAIRVQGRLPDAALAAAYRQAAVVVLPSTTDAEAFGMVLAEANACGRPVIGSRRGGIPDFIEDGHNGRLAEPGDAADLADKLITLLMAPQAAHAMGRAGRDRILERHDWGVLTEQTEAVLEAASR